MRAGRSCGPLDGSDPGDGASLITDLPERLRLGTREWHTRAERSGLMAALVAGRITAAAYGALLRNLHALYEALEAALQANRHDAAIGLLPLDAVRREPALAADLAALRGPSWRDELPLLAATQAYVQRLQADAATRPRALVAHAYLRYLGDLSGGQLLQRQLQRALGAAAPLAFYDFGPPERVLALRQALRDALGRMPLVEAEMEMLVDEARWGFSQHQRLFEALA